MLDPAVVLRADAGAIEASLAPARPFWRWWHMAGTPW